MDMSSQTGLGDTRLGANLGLPEDAPIAQKPTVSHENEVPHLLVHDDSTPPKVFAELEMPHECRLTGSIPFVFVVEYSTSSPEPITIDKSRSPLSEFVLDLKTIEQLIDCRNGETGEEVNWTAFFGCFDSDPHAIFPADDDFVEIALGKPWRFECTLDNMDCEYDTVCSMSGLESGQKYKTQVADSALLAFSRWWYGRKEDLLSGSEEEKKGRWKVDRGKQGSLVVERIGDPVEFTVLP